MRAGRPAEGFPQRFERAGDAAFLAEALESKLRVRGRLERALRREVGAVSAHDEHLPPKARRSLAAAVSVATRATH